MSRKDEAQDGKYKTIEGQELISMSKQKVNRGPLWVKFPLHSDYHFKIRPVTIEELNSRDPDIDTLSVISGMLEDWKGVPPDGTPCTDSNRQAFLILNGEMSLFVNTDEDGRGQTLNLYSWLFYTSIVYGTTGGIWVPPQSMKPIFNPCRFKPIDIEAAKTFKSEFKTLIPLPQKGSYEFPQLVSVRPSSGNHN
jgi:hypothetical protein